MGHPEVKACALCAFPERCEDGCKFKDNWPSPWERAARVCEDPESRRILIEMDKYLRKLQS